MRDWAVSHQEVVREAEAWGVRHGPGGEQQ